MKKAIILYIFGLIGVCVICIILMTNGKVPVFDASGPIIYTTTYLEIGPGIALLVGLLAFLTSIFTNFYTNYKNEENIDKQLTLDYKIKSLIIFNLILNSFDNANKKVYSLTSGLKTQEKINCMKILLNLIIKRKYNLIEHIFIIHY